MDSLQHTWPVQPALATFPSLSPERDPPTGTPVPFKATEFISEGFLTFKTLFVWAEICLPSAPIPYKTIINEIIQHLFL